MRIRIGQGTRRRRGIFALTVLGLLLVTLIVGAVWLGLFNTTELRENELRGPYVVVGVEHVGSDRQIFKVVQDTVRPALAELPQKLTPGTTCGVLYDYPWNAPRSSRRNLAGVLLDATQTDAKAEPPLRVELIPRRNVLVVSTDAHRSVASLVLFPKIRRWLAKNHVTPTGPALELYLANGTMEVEVPVAPVAPLPAALAPASPAAPVAETAVAPASTHAP